MHDLLVNPTEYGVIAEYNEKSMVAFLESIKVEDGDVILDIGAHIGTFSVLASRRWPKSKIYAFEPVPENCDCLMANLKENGCGNVIPYELAITSDCRPLEMTVCFESNSGGASGFVMATGKEFQKGATRRMKAPSTTLQAFMNVNGIKEVKLLKMDVEGAEHEIVAESGPLVLPHVEYICGEIHINELLRARGFSLDGTLDEIAKHIPADKMHFVRCEMSE